MNGVIDDVYVLDDDHFFLGGLGSLTPRTLSILAIIWPVGTDFPASQEFTSDFGT
jgi:hypothetical protein